MRPINMYAVWSEIMMLPHNGHMIDEDDVFEILTNTPVLELEPQWISVEEGVPQTNVTVLGYYDGGCALAEIYMHDYEGNPVWSYTGLGGDPTHWLPLPEPPKED